ncbi:MAG: hypothetical protein KIT11_00065 [Fimbriimonadaceae bacterium]|nr:hypothetical protein [Fimbriimonadaceae bacterium]QYK55231.1 MAG: hypothetical protein KF733_09470 [Fimbriimonadaceae bacterium]
MPRTIFAAYQDPAVAEHVFAELLNLGVPSEDLSLVLPGEEGTANKAVAEIEADEDHPEELRTTVGRLQAEGLPGLVESRIGGGIATSTWDDSVSSLDEMDESQEAAEDFTSPLSGESFGEGERADALQFREHGSVDPLRGGGETLRDLDREYERPFSVVVVQHFVLAGDGPLTTEVLAAGEGRRDSAGKPLAEGLLRLGASESESDELERMFDSGGAVLAVREVLGAVSMDEIESIVANAGDCYTVGIPA